MPQRIEIPLFTDYEHSPKGSSEDDSLVSKVLSERARSLDLARIAVSRLIETQTPQMIWRNHAAGRSKETVRASTRYKERQTIKVISNLRAWELQPGEPSQLVSVDHKNAPLRTVVSGIYRSHGLNYGLTYYTQSKLSRDPIEPSEPDWYLDASSELGLTFAYHGLIEQRPDDLRRIPRNYQAYQAAGVEGHIQSLLHKRIAA